VGSNPTATIERGATAGSVPLGAHQSLDSVPTLIPTSDALGTPRPGKPQAATVPTSPRNPSSLKGLDLSSCAAPRLVDLFLLSSAAFG
jgi:hypothetical protein